ncbi:MFS transporter [Oceaniglobus roseus]|uniref:MFS transporter n=1 Tax=Oceaniglobus roseus TaxID=1737570 RepID=UPI000C7EE55E|nr:MFS transporter [Kandeliimicrobium roseum]
MRFGERVRQRAVPLIVAVALFMENLDASVLSTSLPQIARDLGTDPIHLKLALTSYLLALAVFIPASGWAADRFGARRLFRLAIAVFAAGSIACGLSQSLGGLVAARVLQGLGGAMMVPVGRLIVLRATPKAGLVGALAWLTVPALIGPVMGPLVGGAITTYANWRWIFWINIPIAVLGVFLVTRFIPKLPPAPKVAFDATGFVLAGPGVALFLTGLTMAGLGVAPAPVVAAMVVGGLALCLGYVRHAFAVERPLVDLRLLRLPTFRVAVVGGLFFRTGGGAIPFLLPLLLQLGFGLSAFQSGSLTFATGIGAILMKFIAQPVLQRFGFRRVLLVNAFVAAGFLAVPALFTPQTPALAMVLVLFLGGVCRSLQFTALNALAYAEVPSERLGSATSFSAVLQQLSQTLGITVAAFGLEAVLALTGRSAIVAAAFPPVFVLVGLVSLSSVLWLARLTGRSGESLLARPAE